MRHRIQESQTLKTVQFFSDPHTGKNSGPSKPPFKWLVNRPRPVSIWAIFGYERAPNNIEVRVWSCARVGDGLFTILGGIVVSKVYSCVVVVLV